MKKTTPLLFHYNLEGHGKSNPLLLRLEINPNYTKVDFGYPTLSKYIKGGWIKMAAKTFIEIKESRKRFTLTQTEGIPIAPKKLIFLSDKDWQYFSLYFPPIPKVDCTINLIEAEKGTQNDFNYYDIPIKISKGFEIISKK